MTETYDNIVVGAGIVGSATAYHLAKEGQKTLLLEQFSLPHSRGSSHGQTRITRRAYGNKDHYSLMMEEAFQMWSQLEAETETKLYKQTGVLTMGSIKQDFVSSTIKNMRKHNLPMDILTSHQAEMKYPMISYPDDFTFVLDHSGGILRSEKALKGFQEQFIKFGGVLLDNEPMTKIIPGDIVTVESKSQTNKCRSIVLTVGPWTNKILSSIGVNLPLKPLRIAVCFWKQKIPGEYSIQRFPVFTQRKVVGQYGTYGLPSEEYPDHYKLCLHYGPDIDPDNVDAADDEWALEILTKFVSKHFPNLDPKPNVIRTCIYSWLPDEEFVLDTHPKWKNIVVGAGFSGHGFKLAPVIGKVLGEIAMGKKPSYDLSPCTMSRFIRKSKI